MIGFQLRVLRVSGLGLPPADITFGPGLNIVSGASDTGKSFLFQTIDYMFGAASHFHQKRQDTEHAPFSPLSSSLRGTSNRQNQRKFRVPARHSLSRNLNPNFE
jgi:DNA repair ATPase RecN